MPRAPPLLPFLDGPARVQMGLSALATDAWLLPDTERAWLPEKRRLLVESRATIYAPPADADAACAASEAAEVVRCALGADTDADADPLLHAASLVSDDLVVMQRRDGRWRLTSAVLCAPTFWSLRDFAGGDLQALHAAVPGAPPRRDARRLPDQMAKLFESLVRTATATVTDTDTGACADMDPAPAILTRANWTVQYSDARFTPSSAPLKQAAADAIRGAAGDAKTLRDVAAAGLHLRVERQTLRALPGTGAVLFTIRVLVDPLVEALRGDAARAAFASAWRTTDAALRVYKGWPTLDPLIEALLQTAP